MTQAIAEPRQQPSLQSLERGLAVLQVFSAERSALTLSDVARLAGITRATARRILLTLEKLGHVRSDGRLFSLTPRVLTLGWAYLSSLNIWEVAQPLMQELSRTTGESCSIATLDLPEVVNVAHVAPRRIVNVALGVGLRMPVHATCMGRVLLAGLPERSFDAYLTGAELERLTPETIVDRAELAQAVQTTREQGWTLSDQELEVGLRSVAAPIVSPDGKTVAAMNVFGATSRVSGDQLREEFLPALLETAGTVSKSMRAHALAFAVASATCSAGCSVGLERFGDSSSSASSGDCSTNDDLVAVPTDGLSFGSVSAWGDAATDAFSLGTQPSATRAVVVSDVSLDPDYSQAFDVAFSGSLSPPVRIQPNTPDDLVVSFPGADYQNSGSTGSFTGQLDITYEIDAAHDTCVYTRSLTGTICADSGKDGHCG